MARKQVRISRRMLFTWFMLAGFILLFAPRNLTNKFQFAFARIFRWPLRVGRSFRLSVPTPPTLAGSVSRRKYDQLQNHIANLAKQLDLEHKQLEELSGMRLRLPLQGAKLVPAAVIRASFTVRQCRLIINRGRNDGLAVNQFVLGDNSVIGTICEVANREAHVKLFTDPTSRIEVSIDGLKIDRVMHGSGSNLAKIPLVSRDHKIKERADIFARRKPGLLDAPMIMARVARHKRDDQDPTLWEITVKPACDLERLEQVAVIIMNP
ncbi:MAG: rod shape-determining protein MreC [Planctomycetota bacterium]